MRLLLVEDEDDLVATIRPVLVREGYAVDAAGGIEAAREKLACNTYDVMVLDLNLPDGDGYELCLALRRRELETPAGPDLRVLMLTARDGLSDRVRGLNDGADDYLVSRSPSPSCWHGSAPCSAATPVARPPPSGSAS
jgi:DNA-binding response OmpR family regulator